MTKKRRARQPRLRPVRRTTAAEALANFCAAIEGLSSGEVQQVVVLLMAAHRADVLIAAHRPMGPPCVRPTDHLWRLRPDQRSFACVLCNTQAYELRSYSSPPSVPPEALRQAQKEAETAQDRARRARALVLTAILDLETPRADPQLLRDALRMRLIDLEVEHFLPAATAGTDGH